MYSSVQFCANQKGCPSLVEDYCRWSAIAQRHQCLTATDNGWSQLVLSAWTNTSRWTPLWPPYRLQNRPRGMKSRARWRPAGISWPITILGNERHVHQVEKNPAGHLTMAVHFFLGGDPILLLMMYCSCVLFIKNSHVLYVHLNCTAVSVWNWLNGFGFRALKKNV